jgi:hypothetical protein
VVNRIGSVWQRLLDQVLTEPARRCREILLATCLASGLPASGTESRSSVSSATLKVA